MIGILTLQCVVVFCPCPPAPLALALAGTTFCIFAFVFGYFEVLHLLFASHHGCKEPVDDVMPQLCTLTCKQEGYYIYNDGLFLVYVYTLSTPVLYWVQSPCFESLPWRLQAS